MQDVFSTIWTRRTQRGIDNLPGYLLTATRYRVLTLVSQHQSHRFFRPFMDILEENDTPEQGMIAKELLAVIHSYANAARKKAADIYASHTIKILHR